MRTKTVYQCDENGIYVCTTVADESPLEPGIWLIPAGAIEVKPPVIEGNQLGKWNGEQWLVEERSSASPDPDELPPNEEAEINTYKIAIQRFMDTVAAKRGYDGILVAISYAEEPAVPKFQAEGRAFRSWRSLVWAYGYEQIEAIQSGARPAPTIEELIIELPVLELRT